MAFIPPLELIVDCVLTDKGRQLISRGDGSFKVASFAPVDTEIDYSLYDTGAIESVSPANILNTPILEAITNESAGEQFELMTISDPKVRYLPTLQLGASTVSVDEFLNGSATEKIITVTPAMSNKSTIPAEIVDTLYIVRVNDKFLEVSNYSAYLGIDTAFDYAGYAVAADSSLNSYNGRNLTCQIKSKPIDDVTWASYGSGISPVRTITTHVIIRGAISGLETKVTVTINEKA